MNETYTELFKDPRWQKKRLEIFERDGWACKRCGKSSSSLAVHHRLYRANTLPWDYDNSELVTLCEPCHEQETKWRKLIESELIQELRARYFVDDLYNILCSFYVLPNTKIFPKILNGKKK